MADFRSKTDEFFYDNYTRAWVGTTVDNMLPVYLGEMSALLLDLSHDWDYHQEFCSDYRLALQLTQEIDGRQVAVKKPDSPYQLLWKTNKAVFLKGEQEVYSCSLRKFFDILAYYIGQLHERFGVNTTKYQEQLERISQTHTEKQNEKRKDTLRFWDRSPGCEDVSFEGAKSLHLHTKDIASFQQLNCQDTLRSFQADCMPRTRDVECLEAYTNLKCLYLRDMKLRDIRFLAPLTQLDELGLPGNQITDLSPLADMKRLTHLYLVDNPVTDFSVVEQLPKLRTLYVDDKQMPDQAAWDKIPDRITLKVLHVTPLGDGKYHAETVYTNKRPAVKEVSADPRHLNIKDRWLYSGLKNTLGHDPRLRYDLSKVKVLDCSDSIPLCVDHTFLTELGDYSCLAEATKLHTLNLSGRVVKDFGWIKNCTALKKLDLSNTNFHDLSLLAGCSHLTTLDLSGCKNLKKEDAGLLRKMTSLKNLHLADTVLEEYTSSQAHATFIPSPKQDAVPAVKAKTPQPTAHITDQKELNVPPSTRIKKIVDWLKEHTAQSAYTLTVESGVQASLTDSKFGGLPYWDMTKDYPVDPDGNKMILLAQINLKDLAGESPFPKTGLLQFFLANDDMLGLDTGSAVIYHEQIDPTVTTDMIRAMELPNTLELDEDSFFPFEEELAVSIHPITAFINPEDFRFDGFFAQALQEVCGEELAGQAIWQYLNDEERHYLWDELMGGDHQMLGYGYFTQSDPRACLDGPEDHYDTMLFQMDSDDGILWGDCGVANFFISHEDLEKRDFHDVLYNWDCC